MIPKEVLEKLRESKLLTIQDYDKINPLKEARLFGPAETATATAVD